jgi:hypothetical protein
MDSLPGKLRSLLVSSKNQLPNPLKDEVKLLIQDLQEARNLLVDLSGPEPPESMVKLWRNEVREMSYDLEDYIDKTTHPYSNQFEVEEFGTLVDLARDACKSYRRYHLGRLWPSNPSSIASEHGFVPKLNREAKYIVGIDDARHKLINWIRDDAEQQLKVVPILGPVGVGKTALAQEVYREIGGEYHCRAFVRASRMPDTRRLLRSIISQVQRRQRPPYGYTVQKLIDCVSEYLQHKRYVSSCIGLSCFDYN